MTFHFDKRSERKKITSSMSHSTTCSTVSCLRTSRTTPPSPPPITRTFLGLGWLANGIWVIISWYLHTELIPILIDDDDKENSRKLISFGTLNNAIQHQHVSVCCRLKNKYILEERFFRVQDFIDFQCHGLTRPLRRDFTKPAIWYYDKTWYNIMKSICVHLELKGV